MHQKLIVHAWELLFLILRTAFYLKMSVQMLTQVYFLLNQDIAQIEGKNILLHLREVILIWNFVTKFGHSHGIQCLFSGKPQGKTFSGSS